MTSKETTSPWVRDSDSREKVGELARQFTTEHVLVLEDRIKRTAEMMRSLADLNLGLAPDEMKQIADLLEGKP